MRNLGGAWLARLQHEIGEAALTIGGFDHLSWNRRIQRLPRQGFNPQAAGAADWDGTLYYHLKDVVEPLRELEAHRGEARPRAVLRRCKEAIATMLHETYHMVAPADHEQIEGRAVIDQPSTAFMEEGVTEIYTQHRLDDVIRMVGLDLAAPGICDVELPPAYPQFVPGTERLLTWVAERIAVPYHDLLEELVGETAAGKYPMLCEALLVNTGLVRLLPAPDLWAARRELENTVRSAFDQVVTVPPHRSSRIAASASVFFGESARTGVRDGLELLRQRHEPNGGPETPAPGQRRAAWPGAPRRRRRPARGSTSPPTIGSSR
jgi:hypothetical protein